MPDTPLTAAPLSAEEEAELRDRVAGLPWVTPANVDRLLATLDAEREAVLVELREVDDRLAGIEATNRLLAATRARSGLDAGLLREAVRAAGERFDAAEPFLYDYPMTQDERQSLWERLRETTIAYREAIAALASSGEAARD